MTPERLKKIEEIYHAVLEIPGGKRELFLNESCGEDVELRREMESLLSFEKSFAGIIDSSPALLVAEVFSEKPTFKLIGTQINQYKIISLLGEGGMGMVFLAQDTKLERKVAIKFLTDKFSQDANRLNRFFLEAKSASALNHPNIITVHEIGEIDHKPFIATEFIDGITLKQYFTKEKLTFTGVLDIAIQIVSALSTAHQAGIIHRDIKPDNVMIRRDGIVKVLDFGLAKLSQSFVGIDTEAKTQAKLSTVDGMIMGTPQFMSPEQVRGKGIDARTDIWSFGVLFYQLLTGKLPFEGETTSDIIAAILKSEPLPLKQVVAEIPTELERITLKTLQKNKNERYRTSDELLENLKHFRREIEFLNRTEPINFRDSDHLEQNKITDAPRIPNTAENSHIYSGKINSFISQTFNRARVHPVISLLFGAVFAVLAIAGIIGYSRSNSSVISSDAFQKMKLAKLTYDGNTTNVVTVSPDGKYIVYALRDEGKETLMVRQVLTSAVIKIVPPADVKYLGFIFSNDGNFIYYVAAEKGVGYLYEIPVLGGNPRKIADNVRGMITLSPTGDAMAFVRARTSLMITDAKGGSQKVLATSAEGEFRVLTAWSPDGKTIMSSIFSTVDSSFHLSEVSVNDGTEKRVSNTSWLNINGLAWLSDGSGVIISGRDPATKFSQIWFVSYPNGEPRRITNDFSTYLGLSLTSDNKSLVVAKEERLYNIWVADGENQTSFKQITSEEGKDEGASGIDRTPDGKIVYTAQTTATINIWIVNADGSGNQQLTFDQSSNFFPVVSPDGRYVVFTSTRTGNLDLWRMDIDGRNLVALTNTPEVENNASFTPDGSSIVYQRNGDEKTTIWKISKDGGNPIQLTETETSRPTVSPDGKFFACDYRVAKGENSTKLAIYPIEGGTPLKILDLPAVVRSRSFSWASDGKAIIYVDRGEAIQNLRSQPLDNSAPKQLTNFKSGQITCFYASHDAKGFALSRGNESTDVVMMTDFK